jgi:hypothetical protein
MLINLKKDILVGISMRKKALFFLAGVFLAIALAGPTILLINQANSDLNNIIAQENPGMETSRSIPTSDQVSQSHQTTFILILLIEAIFVSLFAITIYFAINQ